MKFLEKHDVGKKRNRHEISGDVDAALSTTYGATTEDNHVDIDEESSDASSQYSSKMGLLTAEDRKAGNDAEYYLRQSPLGRAYPERTLALLVTLMLELPTLFIISGGSDKLCTLIGRRR